MAADRKLTEMIETSGSPWHTKMYRGLVAATAVGLLGYMSFCASRNTKHDDPGLTLPPATHSEAGHGYGAGHDSAAQDSPLSDTTASSHVSPGASMADLDKEYSDLLTKMMKENRTFCASNPANPALGVEYDPNKRTIKVLGNHVSVETDAPPATDGHYFALLRVNPHGTGTAEIYDLVGDQLVVSAGCEVSTVFGPVDTFDSVVTLEGELLVPTGRTFSGRPVFMDKHGKDVTFGVGPSWDYDSIPDLELHVAFNGRQYDVSQIRQGYRQLKTCELRAKKVGGVLRNR